MSSVLSLLSGLVVTLALGAWGTFYFRTTQRRRDEAAAGIRALSAMRWREFAHFVLDAMRHRGFEVLSGADQAERGQQTEFLLERDGQRALLSCKHGSAYRIGAPAIAEFASSIRLQGANSGILVTPGHIEPAARRPAADAAIELVDGERLWPEISPLLPASLTDDVSHLTQDRTRQKVALAWVVASVAGLVTAGLLTNLLPATLATPEAGPLAAQAPAASRAAPSPATEAPRGATEVAAPATEAGEAAQRGEVAKQIGLLHGVIHAVWSTRSTLLVEVDEASSERLADICDVLVRYEALRTSRVQLQPPADSGQQVRFKQCRTL